MFKLYDISEFGYIGLTVTKDGIPYTHTPLKIELNEFGTPCIVIYKVEFSSWNSHKPGYYYSPNKKEDHPGITRIEKALIVGSEEAERLLNQGAVYYKER